MRKKVLMYQGRNDELPQLGIIFCGNRAVVSFRPNRHDEVPKDHIDVFYGLFFWLRLGIACMKPYYKNIHKTFRI